MRSNIFDRLSFYSLFLVIVLLPLFCLPFSNIPIETSKGLLLVVGLVACIIFWAIARFIDGKVIIPKSWLTLSGFGVVLVSLLSALFSGTREVSLFGTMFDIGSFWFIFAAFLLMFMSSVIFRTSKQAKIVLLGAILSSVLVLFFQGVHLFAPTALSLGILAGKTSNILGSWNALGLFAGFSGLMFLLVIEFFPISKIEKLLLEILTLLPILMAAAVNFSLVWILLGVSSLIIFVYKVSVTFKREENTEGMVGETEKKTFPIISFVVVIISLLFFMSSGFIGNFIPNRLQISNAEIGPSLPSTISVTKGVLSKDPVFGVGPNRFGEAWAMYKPLSINNSQFWDISFNFGSGLLPTFAATTGALGILSWIAFLALFLITGLKSVLSSIKNRVNWEIVAFFVLSLYLFISSFFYPVGTVLFLLALSFTGIFIGLTTSNGGKELSMSFSNDHRKSFVSTLLLLILVIISVFISFKYIEKFVSVAYFNKTIGAPDIAVAESSIKKALALHINDVYLRTYSQVYLVKFDALVKKGDSLTDVEKADLQSNFDQAVSGVQLAVRYDPTNYLNSQTLGFVYQSLASFGVKDIYSKALEAYQAASLLNPNNPGIKLAMASAAFSDGKVKEAKEFANVALTLKPDYIDALITLSQIARREGSTSDAISYAQKALPLLQAQLSANPQNASLIEQNKNLVKYIDSLKTFSNVPATLSTPTPPTPQKP